MIDEWETEAPRERWLLSYADLVTLLLAFFVVMYSVSAVNEEKLSELASTLSTSFQGAEQEQENGETSQEVDTLKQERETIEQTLDDLYWEFDIESDVKNDQLTINLPGALLFASGTSELSAAGAAQLNELLPLLRFVTGVIEVEGHTDNQAINSEKFPSNWELSAHRAATTARILSDAGIRSNQLRAVGLGSSQPIALNNTSEGRDLNRRVVIRLGDVDWKAFMEASREAREVEPEPLRLEEVDPALLEELLRELDGQRGQ